MGHFGDKFREAREKKELTLDQVSNVTKISSRMLKAIEEEQFDQLPGGVFNKGFIRAYAKHLGLNDEEAVNEYITCLREAQVDAHEVWEPSALPATQPAAAKRPEAKPAPKQPAPKPPATAPAEELPDLQLPRAEDIRPPRRDFTPNAANGIPWRLVAVAVVTVILAMVLWIRHSRAERTSTAMANTQTTTNQPAAAPPASQSPDSLPATAAAQPATNPATAPSNSMTPAAQAAVSSPPAPPPSTPRPATAASSNPGGNTTTPKANVTEHGDVTVRSFDKSPSKPANQASTTLTLVIRASENSWISVLADGQLVTQETLIAPANTSVHASREITVRIGNAAGISFLYNGKEVPAQGNESEVKTVIFDGSGFKSVAGQSAPAN